MSELLRVCVSAHLQTRTNYKNVIKDKNQEIYVRAAVAFDCKLTKACETNQIQSSTLAVSVVVVVDVND